jgi:hypothetical protein
MEGVETQIGDTVFDVLLKTGRVVQHLPSDSVRVEFGTSRRVITFNQNGVRSGYPARTLYWRDPVIVAPLPSDRQWATIQAAARAMIDVIRRSTI